MDMERLQKSGFYYEGVHKRYVGYTKLQNGKWENAVDTCGFYRREDNMYVAYVTDSERGLIQHRIAVVSTVSDLYQKLLAFAEREEFIYQKKEIMQNLEDTEIPRLIQWLIREHGYSEKEAEECIAYLKKDPNSLFELVYFMKNGDFVPDTYECNYYGYTARGLFIGTCLTLPGAFNYMAYLKTEPKKALENIKKGLPRK